ncbi:major facilitator superfamily protein [Ahrensia sp. R2A130]|nr:major facilitator superfamily protein [Ahrensia sp. R2A130]
MPGVMPTSLIFLLEAFVLGNWIPRIPEVKAVFGFTASELGLALFVISLGTMIAFLAGSFVTKLLGLRLACTVFNPIWALSIMAIPFMPNGLAMGPVLLAAGISIGMTEIGMNTAIDRLEVRTGRRLMSKAHGFWSLGSLLGAGVGTGFAVMDVSLTVHFALVLGATALVMVWAGLSMPEFDRAKLDDGPPFKLPNRGLILLCIMPIGIMLIEGAFIDWSALFVQQELQAGPLAIGSIFSAFALVMTVTRFSGDMLLERFGSLRVARVSGVSATFGIALFSLSQSVPVAFLGALFSGLGVAIFYPLVMSAAAKRPGDSEDNVAAMSLFAFTAFMIAPPAIGFLADAIGLRWALALLIPISMTALVLSGELKKDA